MRTLNELAVFEAEDPGSRRAASFAADRKVWTEQREAEQFATGAAGTGARRQSRGSGCRERTRAPPPASERKKRKHPGRQTLPADLPRVERVIACTPEQCVCGNCGRDTKVIGYEVSEVLDVEPARYFVK